MIDRSQVAHLCAELRRLLQRRLAPGVGQALNEIDSRWWAMASAARVASDEQRLLDGLRELRRQRVAVEHGFVSRLGSGLIGDASDDRARPVVTPLALYATDELEEGLALDAIATAIDGQLHLALHGLNCRLANLLDRPGIDDRSNPIGPHALVGNFRDAFRALDVGLDLRLQAYRQLPQHVLGGLQDTYAQCNDLLIRAGVLPELPVDLHPSSTSGKGEATPEPKAASVTRPDSAAATRGPVAAPGRSSGGAPPSAAGLTTDAIAPRGELSDLLQRLLSRRAAQARPPAASLRGQADTREMPRDQLLEATAKLLRSAQPDPRELKRKLLELAQAQAEDRLALSAEDEGTVDLVESLFECMGRDSSLPAALNGTLRGLCLPFLNAALRDHSLLDDPGHPARQLLSEFGDSARGWCAAADPGHRLLRQMQSVQGLLAQRSSEDAAGFQDALQEFREFIAAHRVQVEQAELRAIESTRSREALHQAQIDAQATIESQMAAFKPSPWLRQLLTQHWSAYLVLVMMRYGMVSEHFRQAIGFADAMLTGERDAANPFHAASFRARRLELESQLRQGLATLAYSDEEILRLCGELHSFILVGAAQSRGQSAVAARQPTSPVLEEQPRPETLNPSAMRHLRGLRPGTWFEIGNNVEDAERGRLSWISPVSGRWLLVNWAGRKLVDLPPERMAEDIARGLARVIGDANLLRRAVDSVMTELGGGSASDDPSAMHAER